MMGTVSDAPLTRDAALVVHVWMEKDDPTLRGRVLTSRPLETPGIRGVHALCDALCAELQHLEEVLLAEHRSGDPAPGSSTDREY